MKRRHEADPEADDPAPKRPRHSDSRDDHDEEMSTESIEVQESQDSADADEDKSIEVQESKDSVQEVPCVNDFGDDDADNYTGIVQQPKAFNEKQLRVFELVLRGYNVCIDGEIDTGRTLLCWALGCFLREYCKKQVAMLAPTHATASLIGGETVHSFIGQAFKRHDIKEIIKNVRNNDHLKRRFKETNVMIIDEGQSVEPTLIDDLDAIAQTIRHNTKPFGGIQVVIVTDFYGMPHITQHRSHSTSQKKRPPRFAFQLESWKVADFKHVRLTHVYRKTDKVTSAIHHFANTSCILCMICPGLCRACFPCANG